MSWKLSTLAIAALATLGVGSTLAGPTEQAQAACPGCHIVQVASAAATPAAAADQPSDQEAIAKQKVCPVTDLPLGSMGQPVKIVVKGRTVYLCCAGCKKRLLADPDKYLKKLDEKK